MDKVIPTNGTSAEDIKYANTVKKVYIDGVNVSGCEFFSDMLNGKPDTICKCYKDMYGFDTNCEHNKDAKDCYYKQFKRLERQYEDVLKLAKENADSNEYCLQELEKEVAELKAENERLKDEITKLSDPRYQILKVNEGYYNRMNTYKQALQEIRDIAKGIQQDKIADVYFQKCLILDKINSVIGAEE